MSRKIQITKTLVLVESPAKCKTIEHYLGSSYMCLASFGHIMQLSSLKQIDANNGYRLTYEPMPDKKRHITAIQKALRECRGDVLLACDNDREGEGIAFTLCLVLELDPLTTRRILFNEITESAVQAAVQNPQRINMALVRAQQCRQVLDLLVGYKISPVLWAKVTHNKDNPLSAGRCQTPALRLVYDNQLEVDAAQWAVLYPVSGVFTAMRLTFKLKEALETLEEARAFLLASVTHTHMLTIGAARSIVREPPAPFSTATLLCATNSHLNMGPKQTMTLCQQLYERGLITYMRTDCQKYSQQFLDAAAAHIVAHHGPSFLANPATLAALCNAKTDNDSDAQCEEEKSKPSKRSKKTKTKEAKQLEEEKPGGVVFEAHEAIRPVVLEEAEYQNAFGPDEAALRRLFLFIRNHALQSCMAPQQCRKTDLQLSSPLIDNNKTNNNNCYQHAIEQELFAGFAAQGRTTKELEEITLQNALHDRVRLLQTAKPYAYHQLNVSTTISGKKAHLTEAKLIQLLKDQGIGRPSTYASLIQKIQDRGYVQVQDVPGQTVACVSLELPPAPCTTFLEKMESKEVGGERHKLVLQPLGRLVMEFLLRSFEPLFAYAFTRKMEEQLDLVACGLAAYEAVCAECDAQVDQLVEAQAADARIMRRLDEEHTLIIGKYGPVIRRQAPEQTEATFLAVNPEVVSRAFDTATLDELLFQKQESDDDNVLGEHEGHPVLLKTGKYGAYIEWRGQTKSVKNANGQHDAITLEDAVALLQEAPKLIRAFSDELSARHGPRGPYLFYKTQRMKKPKFFDLKSCPFPFPYDTCSSEEFLAWVHVHHKL